MDVNCPKYCKRGGKSTERNSQDYCRYRAQTHACPRASSPSIFQSFRRALHFFFFLNSRQGCPGTHSVRTYSTYLSTCLSVCLSCGLGVCFYLQVCLCLPGSSGRALVLLTTEPSPAPRLTEVPAAVHDLPTFPTALCSRLAPEVSSHKDISRLASVA